MNEPVEKKEVGYCKDCQHWLRHWKSDNAMPPCNYNLIRRARPLRGMLPRSILQELSMVGMTDMGTTSKPGQCLGVFTGS